MQIKINGDSKEVQEGISLAEVLKISEVENPDLVSVQLDGDFVDKEEYAKITVKENQEVDFLYFMGGGQ